MASPAPATSGPAAKGSPLGRLRARAIDLVLDQPAIFGLVGPWTVDPTRMRRPTMKDTAVVIDGFARSANTFATVAFAYAQGHRGGFRDTRIDIANHWHRPAQFQLAARWKIPAMALIRAPRPTIVSNLIYKDTDDVAHVTRRWLDFYEKVAAVREHVLVVDFKEAITDMGAVIRRLNARYGTGFTPFEHSREHVDAVNAMILAHSTRSGHHLGEGWRASQHLSLPVQGREGLKQAKEALLETPALQPLLQRADALYARLKPA